MEAEDEQERHITYGLYSNANLTEQRHYLICNLKLKQDVFSEFKSIEPEELLPQPIYHETV